MLKTGFMYNAMMKNLCRRLYRLFIVYKIIIAGILVFYLLSSHFDKSIVRKYRYRIREIEKTRLDYVESNVEMNFIWNSITGVNFTWNSVLNALEHVPGSGDFLPSEPDFPSLLYPHGNKPVGLRNEPLTVFVLLHSHNDPGYRRTIDDYYYVITKRVLSLAVENLEKHKDLTFIWTDTYFLDRWWKEQDNKTRNTLKLLVKSGRFEISLGAWVSADECITHYFAYMDQLTEGYNWVHQHFDVFPNVSFNMDQFGSSASVNYMRSIAGVKHSFVNHLHKGIKAHFRKHRLMEFYSRQLWGENQKDDSFIHLEPYDNLGFRGSCGPSKTACLGLDERTFKLPHYKSLSFKLPKLLNGMPYWNVRELAEEVVAQLKMKNDGYLHNVVFLPLGDDILYYTAKEWENQHWNMKVLMEYINSQKEFNVRMQFGTLSKYFEEVRRQTAKYQIKYPIASGDYFPYTRGPKYWSGYFTTRQFIKRLGRELQESVRAVDMLLSFIIYSDFSFKTKLNDFKSTLTKHMYARHQLYILQHHDAITGTAEELVVKDYKQRFSSAFVYSQEVLSTFIEYLLTKDCANSAEPDDLNIQRTIHKLKDNTNRQITSTAVRTGSDELTQQLTINIGNKATKYILYNSYTSNRTDVITVSIKPTSNGLLIRDPYGIPVDFDVEVSEDVMKLSFAVDLPPVSVSVFNLLTHDREKRKYEQSTKRGRGKKNFICQNKEMNVTYSLNDGSPLTVCIKNDNTCLKFKVSLLHYTTVSDAWTFPDSGKNVKIRNYSTYRTVKRKTYCSVEFFYKFIIVKFTLYNVVGVNSMRLQMEIHDNLAKNTADDFSGDFAVRLYTTIENGKTFYTDSNSLQLMKRIYREHLSFGGNIYPMTSMAVIQDDTRRLTVHSSQPHGVISRESGSLDIMIDRVVTSKSDKTVREFLGNTKDNLPTYTKLYFQFEQISQFTQEGLSERLKPSLSSVIVNDLIQHPVFSFYTKSTFVCGKAQHTFLHHSLPRELAVANMKCLFGDEVNLQGLTLGLFRRELSQDIYTNTSLAFDPTSLFSYHFKSVRNMFKERHFQYISNVLFEPLEMKTFLMN